MCFTFRLKFLMTVFKEVTQSAFIFAEEPFKILESIFFSIKKKAEVIAFPQYRNSKWSEARYSFREAELKRFKRGWTGAREERGSYLWKLSSAHRLYLSVRGDSRALLTGTWQQLLLTATLNHTSDRMDWNAKISWKTAFISTERYVCQRKGGWIMYILKIICFISCALSCDGLL